MDKERRKEYNAFRQLLIRKIWQYIIRYVFGYPFKCAICGLDEPYYLTYHHRNENDKSFNIGSEIRLFGVNKKNIKKMLKELEKVDIVCYNCHFGFIHNDEIDLNGKARKQYDDYIQKAKQKYNELMEEK